MASSDPYLEPQSYSGSSPFDPGYRGPAAPYRTASEDPFVFGSTPFDTQPPGGTSGVMAPIGSPSPPGPAPAPDPSSTALAPWTTAAAPATAPQPERSIVSTPALRRGQRLSFTALSLVLVTALGLGVFTYAALASIDVVSLDPLAGFFGWATWVALALVGGFVATVLAVVGLVIARPRRIAGSALAIALVLPGISLAVGVQQGSQALYAHVQQEIEAGGTAVLDTLEANASNLGFDLSLLRQWIDD